MHIYAALMTNLTLKSNSFLSTSPPRVCILVK